MNTGALTFFRFIAALGVVLFHFGAAAGLAWTGHIRSVGLSFFFVLSGFVLFVAYKGGADLDARRFLISRFSRIYPAYFIALILMILVYVIDHRTVDPRAVVLNVLMLQSWVSGFPTSLNYPGWSLSVEAFLYLVFPLVAGLVARRVPSPRSLLLVAFAVWLLNQAVNSLLLSGYGPADPARAKELIAYFPPMYFSSFLLGIAGAYWFRSRPQAPVEGNFALVTSISTLAVLVYIATHVKDFGVIFGIPVAVESTLLAPILLAFTLSIAMAKPSIQQLLRLAPLVVLGEASYSIYILQAPLHNMFSFAFARHFEGRPLLMFACFLVSLIAVSVASLYLFERPAGRLFRSAAGRVRQAPLATAK